jgi:hypothetical protein
LDILRKEQKIPSLSSRVISGTSAFDAAPVDILILGIEHFSVAEIRWLQQSYRKLADASRPELLNSLKTNYRWPLAGY